MNMQNVEFSWFENILSVLFLVIVIFILGWCIRKGIKNATTKTKKVWAKLVAKHQEEVVSQPVFRGNSDFVGAGVVEKRVICVVEFEIEQGTILSLEVEQGIYDELTEGNEERLCYKGEQFISFGKISGSESAGKNGARFKTLKDEL